MDCKNILGRHEEEPRLWFDKINLSPKEGWGWRKHIRWDLP